MDYGRETETHSFHCFCWLGHMVRRRGERHRQWEGSRDGSELEHAI